MSNSLRRRVERLEGPEPALLFDLAAEMKRVRAKGLSLTPEDMAAEQLEELYRRRQQHAAGELTEFGLAMFRGLERVVACEAADRARAVHV